jgi:dolichol-phosphate mannosyltransferase
MVREMTVVEEKVREGVLAVVCPMANEAETVRRFVTEVLEQCRRWRFGALHLVTVLDRASRDGTLQVLRSMKAEVPELRVVYAPENRGVVDAYLRGYREALDLGATWILEMDAGFSHQPAEIPRFLERAQPDVECVFATRFARGGAYQGGIGRRFMVSWLGSWLTRVLLRMPLTDLTSGFQLFSARALRRVVDSGLRSRGPFFQTEIKVLLRDCRKEEVPITYVPTGQAVRPAALRDALGMLFALFRQRLTGRATWPR